MIRRCVRCAFLIVLASCGGKSGDAPAAKQDGGSGIASSADLAAVYDKKCAAGDLEACRSLAIMYSEGVGVGKDLKRAADMFEAACNNGNASACNHFAVALAEGAGVAKNPARAAEMYQKACDGGLGLACRNLGLMLREGKGVAADLPRAETVLEKACTLKAAFGCLNGGELEAMLAATDKSHWGRANALYQKGCDQGEGASCRQIAIAYFQGDRGLPAGAAPARIWAEKGCALKEVVSCRMLGAALVMSGDDVERGKQLLRAACDVKDAEACRVLSDVAKHSPAPDASGSGSAAH